MAFRVEFFRSEPGSLGAVAIAPVREFASLRVALDYGFGHCPAEADGFNLYSGEELRRMVQLRPEARGGGEPLADAPAPAVSPMSVG